MIATLITSVAFVSCNRMQKVVTPAADDMMATDDMIATDDMTMDVMMDKTMYMSWEHVMLPAPGPAESATSPKERGGMHGLGTRTVYINDIGAVANKEGTAYPAGTMVVKVIMDDANTFIAKKAMMMKTDDRCMRITTGGYTKNMPVLMKMPIICKSKGLTWQMQRTAATDVTPKPITTASLFRSP